jgi:hypothetical protein
MHVVQVTETHLNLTLRLGVSTSRLQFSSSDLMDGVGVWELVH